MTKNRHGHLGLPMTLLGLAFVAYIATGQSQHAGANDQYGPFPALQNTSAVVPKGPESKAIQELITKQLQAISERDADLAYGLTTGNLHKKYDTAGKFLAEMRFSYRPVYNHQSFRFLDQTETDTGGLIQRVEVTYTDGDPTVVIYRLQRDEAGAWGIDSFAILETEDGQPI